jgi:hypothetical protein
MVGLGLDGSEKIRSRRQPRVAESGLAAGRRALRRREQERSITLTPFTRLKDTTRTDNSDESTRVNAGKRRPQCGCSGFGGTGMARYDRGEILILLRTSIR